MAEYRSESEAIPMEEALKLPTFVLVWPQLEIKCSRLGSEDRWTLDLVRGGASIPMGSVSRDSTGAFHRSGTPNAYNTFEQAAWPQVADKAQGA